MLPPLAREMSSGAIIAVWELQYWAAADKALTAKLVTRLTEHIAAIDAVKAVSVFHARENNRRALAEAELGTFSEAYALLIVPAGESRPHADGAVDDTLDVETGRGWRRGSAMPGMFGFFEFGVFFDCTGWAVFRDLPETL